MTYVQLHKYYISSGKLERATQSDYMCVGLGVLPCKLFISNFCESKSRFGLFMKQICHFINIQLLIFF